MRAQYAANRDAIDALGVVLWTARAGTWAVESIDPGVVRMLGYDSNAWRVDGFWLERTHNRDRRRLRTFLDRARSARLDRGAFCEYRIYDSGGSVRWLRTSVLRADTEGRTLTGAHLDVTDEHRALEALGLTTRQLRAALGIGEVAGRHTGAGAAPTESAKGHASALRSAERTYRAVWDAVPAASAVLDHDGIVVEVNRHWVKLARRFGRDDAFLGASYLDVTQRAAEWGNGRASEAADGIRRVLLGADDRLCLDYSWTAPGDSDERWFRVRALRLDPPPLGALILHEEITDHAAAESLTRRLDDLTHMQRLATLGELATTIAHDLNQPLTVIMTAASTISRLLRNRHGDDELEPIARDILDAASRAADVMRQTRGIVRRDEAVESIPVNDIVSEVARLLKSDAIIRQVILELRLDPDAGRVAGGRAQLEQVLMNLLLNGIEALREQPHDRRNVFVTTRRVAPSEVEIRVHDTGIGVPEPLRDRVFEPFVTTKRQGTGLGLAIVRAIVQAHGGQVRLETPQERGAAFRVTLPAC